MSTEPSPIEDLLPLTPAIFHILLALMDGEQKHGYAIMQTIAAQTNQGFTIVPTTLYRSTKRMLEQKLITESEARPDPVLDDERRRYYQITNLGRAVAHAERNRLASLVQFADQLPGFGGASYGPA